VVPDDQLSLAIGREGQNARLAARLTGWRVDIRSETEFAQEEAESGYEEEAVQGRCAAILANGRRCPNASLPASRYCGIPNHQALESQPSDYVAGPPAGDAPAEEPALADAPVESLPEDASAEVPETSAPVATVVEEPALEEPTLEEAAEVAAEEPAVGAEEPSP
jgi:N utilization substance protein A